MLWGGSCFPRRERDWSLGEWSRTGALADDPHGALYTSPLQNLLYPKMMLSVFFDMSVS